MEVGTDLGLKKRLESLKNFGLEVAEEDTSEVSLVRIVGVFRPRLLAGKLKVKIEVINS